MTAFGDDNSLTPTPSKRIFVYTAKCGIWLRCSYKLPDPIVFVCDNGWEGGDPHYDVENDKWVNHWRWHSCGQICCKKVYELKYHFSHVEIIGKTKSRYPPEKECSLQNNFWGRRPFPTAEDEELLPCQDGC